MNIIQSIRYQRLSFSKRVPVVLLAFFLLTALLPSCRVKSGCAASQKGYTNNMEKSRKHGKTALFPKAMAKKIKH
jgi:hypothetical protein